ncbi:benzoate transport [Parasphingorhabdus marina DSM 22363]|uniref:Benzoate transport n=1 Tax=Parasphingorhabdus marina DSM 22363 TaxID=1123272 RepID=A0A1N6D3V9_9SPHN|nr:MFS transporter [Parasphingorhabdus marina]SIN65508.1 benzoate transport [Parasphingorhabdus marina DSM 22363]
MDIRQSIEDQPVSWLQLLVLLICFALNILDGFDIVAISYAAPAISDAWSLSATNLGIVFSAGLAGMTVGAMFLAPVTDVIGRRKMILIALVINAISLAATAWSQTLWQLVAARFVVGLSIGSMLASLTALVAEYMPARHRNLAVCILQCGYPIGATGGGFLAAWLIPVHGWESVFLFGLLITVLAIPVVYFALPESLEYLAKRRPASALQITNRVRARMELPALHELAEGEDKDIPSAQVHSLLTADNRRKTLLLWAAYFFCFFTLYFLISWIPKILVENGFTQDQGINAGIAFNGGGILGVLMLGYLADKKGLTRLIGLFLAIGCVSLLAFGTISAGFAVTLLLSFVVGIFVNGGFVGLYAMAAGLYPTEIRTTGIGWAIGAGRFGGIAGPYVGGLLVAAQLPLPLTIAIFALSLIFAIAAVWLMPKDALVS